MELQRTIKDSIELKGIGLHTGQTVRLRFKSAPSNSGINFLRTDIGDSQLISANLYQIVDQKKSPRRTSIGNGQVEVQTVEHLMASLWSLGIDNILIELDGVELPGLDGSATGFLEVLKRANFLEQNAPKKIFQIRTPIWIKEDEAMIIVLPCDDFRISYTLNYDHPILRSQYISFNLDPLIFEREIAPARTFCLQSEVGELKNQGLGKGANYENTVVVGPKGVIDNRLRFEDEFARHKVLDLIGDLYLLGYSIRGHIIAVRSGHPLNLKLLNKIEDQRMRLQEGGIKAVHVETTGRELDTAAIQRILPHRYPFLLIDKIVELEEDKRAVGIKNVSFNEFFFTGHFPNRPVMPGVLIIEAMAQVAGVLMLNKKENVGKIAYFMSLDNAKFRRTVVPGDQLRIEVEVIKLRQKTGLVHTRALVNGNEVSEADLMFALVDA